MVCDVPDPTVVQVRPALERRTAGTEEPARVRVGIFQAFRDMAGSPEQRTERPETSGMGSVASPYRVVANEVLLVLHLPLLLLLLLMLLHYRRVYQTDCHPNVTVCRADRGRVDDAAAMDALRDGVSHG